MSARCCHRSVHTNKAIKHRIPGALTSALVTRTQQIDELYYLALASPLSCAPSHAISHATTVGFASPETTSYGLTMALTMAGRSNQQRRIRFLDVEQADTWQHETRRDSPHCTYHRQCQPHSTHFSFLALCLLYFSFPLFFFPLLLPTDCRASKSYRIVVFKIIGSCFAIVLLFVCGV